MKYITLVPKTNNYRNLKHVFGLFLVFQIFCKIFCQKHKHAKSKLNDAALLNFAYCISFHKKYIPYFKIQVFKSDSSNNQESPQYIFESIYGKICSSIYNNPNYSNFNFSLLEL